ncbi:hypothetical protein TPA0909_27930 [Streptomyces albus]|nr:hypothetical protein TPA0909_27930 [Streptomyces albus]
MPWTRCGSARGQRTRTRTRTGAALRHARAACVTPQADRAVRDGALAMALTAAAVAGDPGERARPAHGEHVPTRPQAGPGGAAKAA